MHGLLLFCTESFRERLIFWVAKYSYLGVFCFLIACGLGMPLPEEVALISGGYSIHVAGTGLHGVLLMVAVAMVGVLLGDSCIYGFGRILGNHPAKVPGLGYHLTSERMARGEAMFEEHGPKVVFAARFMPGLRAPLFFISGSLKVRFGVFLFWDGLAALISVPFSVVLAWYFGGHLTTAFHYIRSLDYAMSVVIAIAIFVFGVLLWRRRRRRIDRSQAEESPSPEAAPASPPEVE